MAESRTISWLFARLIARYGSLWHTKFADVPVAALRADWSRVLANASARQVEYGLDNLPPDFPPDAARFRELCMAMPAPAVPALPAPKRSAAEIERSRRIREQALAGLRGIGKGGFAETRQKAIAQLKDFEERAGRGERLSFAQRDWIAAAKPLLSELQMPGDFKPINTAVLPPAMQPDAHCVAPDGEAG